MLVLNSCRTLRKEVKEETVYDFSTVYFPSFPSVYKSGVIIPKCYDQIVIGDIYYDKAVVIPYWYWELIINYANETEAAIESLVPK